MQGLGRSRCQRTRPGTEMGCQCISSGRGRIKYGQNVKAGTYRDICNSTDAFPELMLGAGCCSHFLKQSARTYTHDLAKRPFGEIDHSRRSNLLLNAPSPTLPARGRGESCLARTSSSGQRGRAGASRGIDETQAESLQTGPGDHDAVVGIIRLGAGERRRRRCFLRRCRTGARAGSDWRPRLLLPRRML